MFLVPAPTTAHPPLPKYDVISRHSWEKRGLPHNRRIDQGIYHGVRWQTGTKEGSLFPWALPNSTQFPEFIKRTYAQYRVKPGGKPKAGGQSKAILPHQDFIKHYLAPETPYRGALLYWGLGSGKTRGCIEVGLQYWRLGWRVVFMSPGSLRDNFITEWNEWTELNGYPQFQRVDLRMKETILASDYELYSQLLQQLPAGSKPNYRKFQEIRLETDPNYMTGADLSRQTVWPEQERWRVHLVTYNHGTVVRRLKELDLKKGKTVVIIDEVHNLISRMTSPTNQTAKPLYKALMSMKNSKIITLSGSPLLNSGYEFGLLFNVLRGPICSGGDPNVEDDCLPSPTPEVHTGVGLFPSSEQDFEQMFIDYEKERPKNGHLFRQRIMGLVSYYRGLAGKGIYPELIDNRVPIQVELSQTKGPSADQWFYYLKARVKEMKQEEGARKGKSKTHQDLKVKQAKLGPSGLPIPTNSNFKSKKPLDGDTFRVKTRLVSNFVLPDDLERPEPSDFKLGDHISKAELNRLMNDAKTKLQSDDVYEKKEEESVVNPNEEAYEAAEEQTQAALEEAGEGETAITTTEKPAPVVGGVVEITKSVKDQIYKARLKSVLNNLTGRHDVFGPEALKVYSPKYLKALELLEKGETIDTSISTTTPTPTEKYLTQTYKIPDPSDPSGKKTKTITNDKYPGHPVFFYSNFLTLEGLGAFAKTLEYYGYKKAPITDKSKIGDKSLQPGQLRYAIFSGDEDSAVRTRTLEIFNDPRNAYGQYIKMIMGTSAAAEGISLKRVRQVFLLEPHWNEVRLDQAIGRARRIHSHSDLPPAEQNVHVYRFQSVLSDAQKKYWMAVERRQEAIKSTDQYLANIASSKKKINDQFLQYAKEAAVDCALNQAHNYDPSDPEASQPIECLTFGLYPQKKFSYVPSYSDPHQVIETIQATTRAIPFDPASASSQALLAPLQKALYDPKTQKPRFLIEKKAQKYPLYRLDYKTKQGVKKAKWASPLYKSTDKKQATPMVWVIWTSDPNTVGSRPGFTLAVAKNVSSIRRT